MSRFLPCVVAVTLLANACAGSQKAPVDTASGPQSPSAVAPVEDSLDLQAFDTVWQTIADKHWDLTRNGLDWNAVRTELRPKVAASQSREEARKIMHELLSRLGQSHFGIIPGEAYTAIKTSTGVPADSSAPSKVGSNAAPVCTSSSPGESGIDVRVLDGQAIVTSILPKSAADLAKVPLGAVIHRVGDTQISDLLAPLQKHYKGKLLGPSTLSRAVLATLSTGEGCTLVLEIQGSGQERTEMSIVAGAPQGEAVQFSNIPGLFVRYASFILPGRVGYLSLSSFFNPKSVMDRFAADMKRFTKAKAKGLIIDLRGNPGGVGAMAMGMSGWLIDAKDKMLGKMITRDSTMNFLVATQVSPFLGKVAILVDGSSLSTSEILAGGLQDLGRARIFGTQTGGAALPSVIMRLPNGDGFQFAVANYISAGGKPLEAAGVIPDELVSPTREALLEGKDLALLAASRWIQE